MDKKKLDALAFLLLLVASTFPLAAFVEPVEAQKVSLTGDTGEVSVVVQSCPGTDRFGLPSVNPDGTFYPNDQFWINYDVYIAGDVNFESVNVAYDRSAFEKVEDSGWGSTSGQALFRVKQDAGPGSYAFTIRATGTRSYNTPSGTVEVTHGGVNVNAYYRAVYEVYESESPAETPGETGGTLGQSVALGDMTLMMAGLSTPKSLAASGAELKLVVEDLKWTTWFDLFRGTVCQATGRLRGSNGVAIAFSDVVAEFLKKNFWTGSTWVAPKTVRTNSQGFFTVEDTCNPLLECFLGVQAWAEKPGFLPSWGLTVSANPSSAKLGRESSFLMGVKVYLSGRYTPVPVVLTVEGLPSGCAATLHPQTSQVDGLNSLQSVVLLKAYSSAPLGTYTLAVKASSGAAYAEATFILEVTELVRVPSTAVFSAHGLGGDAVGTVLVVDDYLAFEAGQLPYVANWDTKTRHSYSWSGYLDSTYYAEYTYEEERVVNNETVTVIKTVIVTKHYELQSVNAVERYVGVATIEVDVVKYDPQFTAVLAYTMPKSPGNNSYEKPFAMIIRYDGNGPARNLGQRAVIEGWDWWGYASERTMQQQLAGFAEVPDISKASPEELEEIMSRFAGMFQKGVAFSVAGLTGRTEGTVLTVDGEALRVEDLPKTYDWPVNSTHSYEWSPRMPVYVWVESPRWGTGHYVNAEDEWFSFEYSLVQPPQIDLKNMTVEEFERVKEHFARGFMSKVKSPSGDVTASETRIQVTGVYAHNKLLKSIAESAGVSQALNCLQPQFPVIFNNESRYAKFTFDLDDNVAREALRQLYNSSAFYELKFVSSAFTREPHVFTANFTCELEYYCKLVNASAVRWDPVLKGWVIDSSVRIEALFDTAFNFTEEDYFRSLLTDQTADETAIKMACQDVYECPPQYYAGLGSAGGAMNRTSPFYYNLNVAAGHGTPYMGTAPEDGDAWTEAVKAAYAVWTSPSCTLSADRGHRTTGAASVKAEGFNVATACAVLDLVKPVEAAGGALHFDIYLDGGCSGNVTVMLQTDSGPVAMSRVWPVQRWVGASFPAEGRISGVGVYCELAEPSGAFWIDGLRFTGARLWGWTDRVDLERTVYVNFATDNPYTFYVNMDPFSPLSVNVTSDDVKRSELTVNAPPELGGLERLTVYLVTNAPPGYSPENMPVESLTLKPILEMNLTAPQRKVEGLEDFTYYSGYAPMYASALGFQGNASLTLLKDPEVKALPYYDKALLLVEAQNVWGTRFRVVVQVQPWGKTYWEVMFDQIAMVVAAVAVASAIIGLIVRLLKWARE
jgi:hypothetical protein